MADTTRKSVEQEVQRLLEQATPPEFVIATPDMLDTILKIRRTTTADYPLNNEWFGFLHLID